MATPDVPTFEGITESYWRRLFRETRKNARVRKIRFSLRWWDFADMINQSDWHCAVTGVPFSLERIGGAARRPYAPSLDRIDSTMGYSVDNCRLVCVAANIAMNQWGDEVLFTLARAMVKRGVL